MRSVKAREPVFPAQSAASPSSSTLTISSLPRAWLICIGICHLNHQRCGTSAMAANGACPRTPGTRRKTPRCRAKRQRPFGTQSVPLHQLRQLRNSPMIPARTPLHNAGSRWTIPNWLDRRRRRSAGIAGHKKARLRDDTVHSTRSHTPSIRRARAMPVPSLTAGRLPWERGGARCELQPIFNCNCDGTTPPLRPANAPTRGPQPRRRAGGRGHVKETCSARWARSRSQRR